MISLICKNCLSLIPVDNGDLEQKKVTHCPNCDTCLDTGSLCPTEQRVNSFVRDMFRALGIEATLEFIDKAKDLPYISMYKKVVEQLGLRPKKRGSQ
jgi:hypothetical protein